MKNQKTLILLVFVLIMIVLQQNCSKVSFQEMKVSEVSSSEVPDEISATATPAVPVDEPESPNKLNSCLLPDGKSSIESGIGKIFFTLGSDEVSCDKVEFRSCYDGRLSGSFTKTGCGIIFKTGIQEFQGCDTPIGKIDHSSSILLFNEESGNCEAQLRICNDGLLSGGNTFSKVSCRLQSLQPSGNSCSLDWNGKLIILPHNNRLIGFSSEKAAIEMGQSCKLSSIRCDNGVIVGNSPISSSCREKKIEELPAGSLLTGHAYNSSKVFVSYKISEQVQNTNCTLEYQINNSWFPVPNLESSFNCNFPTGSVIKTTVDLRTISTFRWTAVTLPTGQTQISSRIRIRSSTIINNSLKYLICIKRTTIDSAGTTPEIDEDCDGIF